MLQRLFARHASEERIDDAVEHSSAMEQQDALRTRSAVILERLARRKAVVHRQEVEARRAAREATDRAAEEAKHEVSPASTGEAGAPADATAKHEPVQDVPDVDVRSGGQDMNSRVPSQENPARRPAEPAAEPATQPVADEGPAAEATGEESREFDRFEPETQGAHPVPDIHDDPEALEQIRLKAKEAKARIAARLEQMDAGHGSADPAAGRLELGDNTPPTSPDDGEL